MKKITESSNLIALDIAEKLVKEEIPFRVTHKIYQIQQIQQIQQIYKHHHYQ